MGILPREPHAFIARVMPRYLARIPDPTDQWGQIIAIAVLKRIAYFHGIDVLDTTVACPHCRSHPGYRMSFAFVCDEHADDLLIDQKFVVTGFLCGDCGTCAVSVRPF